jgi:hypothetical protein
MPEVTEIQQALFMAMECMTSDLISKPPLVKVIVIC